MRHGSSRDATYADFRRERSNEALLPIKGIEPTSLLVILAHLGLPTCQPYELDDPFEQFSGGASRGRENDDFQTKGQRKARTEDGDAEGLSLCGNGAAAQGALPGAHVLGADDLTKRRGVDMSTSEFDFSQPYFFMMAGRSVSHDPL